MNNITNDITTILPSVMYFTILCLQYMLCSQKGHTTVLLGQSFPQYEHVTNCIFILYFLSFCLANTILYNSITKDDYEHGLLQARGNVPVIVNRNKTIKFYGLQIYSAHYRIQPDNALWNS